MNRQVIYTISIAGIAAALLITANTALMQIPFQVLKDPFLNGLAKYQMYALLIALSVSMLVLKINPESRVLLGPGQTSIIAEKSNWLGINGKTKWTANGWQLMLFISLATALFMYAGLVQSDSTGNFRWTFVPWVLLFSALNALTEELIFRFGIVGMLTGHAGKARIMLLSAIMFGLPHYFGNPSGAVGVLMSGILGYVLCKATIETRGLLIAWGIHFVQDIIIFTALMMMTLKA